MTKLKEMILSAALALGGCDYTVKNYYDSESDRTWDGQEIDNECNSPLFGAHMWEIYRCTADSNLHLREDCLVGVKTDYGDYDYQPQGIMVRYEGLKLIPSNRGEILVFDPNFRFSTETTEGTGQPGTMVTFSEAERFRRLNEIMDQYNGHLLDFENGEGRRSVGDCSPTHADDGCIFVPESRPGNSEDCKASPYNN